NIKIKEIEGSRRIFEIEISADAIVGKFEEVYAEIQKEAEIPGFRAGKAPRYLIETHYKDKAREEVKKRLIADHIIKAVKGAGIAMIGAPQVSDILFETGKPLKFKAEVSVRPEVRLKSYKGLKVKKAKVQVSTENVDKVIEELRERYAQLKDVEGRSAKEGDWCLCDVEISVEGKPGEKNEGVWFPLKPQSTKPEFLSQLTGANPGDTKTVKTVLPANYHKKEQAGKEAIFIVTVNQIKERILPEVDDEFAKDLGGFKSLLELRGNIREELTNAKEQEIKFKMEEELLGQLIKSVNFEAPTIMVDSEMDRLLKETRSRLQHIGYKQDEIEKQEPAMKDRMKEEAVKRVKGFFILEKVAETEGIAPSEEELNKRIELLAARSKRSAEEMKSYLTENDLMEDIKAEMAQDKALEFLVANAKIEEEK
ncbi:MAG: trigger factor, partial [Candidatus Omnitrophota bacterium]|nr:trigger factor [Candidatus Omnitrophota bacterium]